MLRKMMLVALGGMLMAGPVLADNKLRNADNRQSDDRQTQQADDAAKVPTPSELENLSRSERVKKMKEAADARNNTDSER
jgi:hypothetical protein